MQPSAKQIIANLALKVVIVGTQPGISRVTLKMKLAAMGISVQNMVSPATHVLFSLDRGSRAGPCREAANVATLASKGIACDILGTDAMAALLDDSDTFLRQMLSPQLRHRFPITITSTPISGPAPNPAQLPTIASAFLMGF